MADPLPAATDSPWWPATAKAVVLALAAATLFVTVFDRLLDPQR